MARDPREAEDILRNVLGELEQKGRAGRWRREYRAGRLLRRIPDQAVIDSIGMARMPKILYVLTKKYRKGPELIPAERDVILRVGKLDVARMSYLAPAIHFLSVSGRDLCLEGNLSLPAGVKGVSFYARVNGERMEAQLEDCGLDLAIGDEVYEKRTVFRLKIPLEEERITVEFFNQVMGTECPHGRINSLRFAPAADCIRGQYCAFGGGEETWIVRIEGPRILCRRTAGAEWEAYERNYQRQLRLCAEGRGDWAAGLRQKYFEEAGRKKKPVWLIMDRSDRADDNGEIFFRYLQGHGEIDSYFVIEENCKDYRRLEAVGKVVPMYSERHLLLALLADCVISSQCNGYVENPFWEEGEYFRDLYHRPRLIFLQHGVIKDDMSPTLNRFHTNFTGFVTSTEAEYRSILEYPYFYEKEKIWLTGLPVLDELEHREQRVLVIAPTWRRELMEQRWDERARQMRWVPRGDLRESEYYKRYRELLGDGRLRESCARNHFRLAFKPHPLLESYLGDIVEGTEAAFWGEEVSYRDMLSTANLLVTDYSSIAFEFAYLGKSTLYYQFDRDRFFRGHTYRRGYFDYVRDGFGEVCVERGELVERLAGYLETGCAVKDVYAGRMAGLYPFRGGACGRIYEKIREAGG